MNRNAETMLIREARVRSREHWRRNDWSDILGAEVASKLIKGRGELRGKLLGGSSFQRRD